MHQSSNSFLGFFSPNICFTLASSSAFLFLFFLFFLFPAAEPAAAELEFVGVFSSGTTGSQNPAGATTAAVLCALELFVFQAPLDRGVGAGEAAAILPAQEVALPDPQGVEAELPLVACCLLAFSLSCRSFRPR